MPPLRPLRIIGASVRAAAFSALRAGILPECADLFADQDLRAVCSAVQLPATAYPTGFREFLCQEPPSPWMYTGALENSPDFIDEIDLHYPLFGNRGESLRRVRSPREIECVLRGAGLPVPRVWQGGAIPPTERRWVSKPLRSGGGIGVQLLEEGHAPPSSPKPTYIQEFIEGAPHAAVYLGHEATAELLGVTRQLIGEPWLHAAPFHYCGSIGPIPLTTHLRRRFEELGRILSVSFGLRGLFGVDVVVRDEIPYVVEVNPRYTASIEVLELACGMSAVARHGQVFDPSVTIPDRVAPWGEYVGKAILFARDAFRFPGLAGLAANHVHYADIPADGEGLEAGRPVLTVLTRGSSMAECRNRLEEQAAALDRSWFVR